ncbi:hypothetical protein ABW20_dc0109700 [Dactylellina cionopaga]|nr:hypothetical protein ABW20_dc0109700 [Dactylellina cionopaga]
MSERWNCHRGNWNIEKKMGPKAFQSASQSARWDHLLYLLAKRLEDGTDDEGITEGDEVLSHSFQDDGEPRRDIPDPIPTNPSPQRLGEPTSKPAESGQENDGRDSFSPQKPTAPSSTVNEPEADENRNKRRKRSGIVEDDDDMRDRSWE